MCQHGQTWRHVSLIWRMDTPITLSSASILETLLWVAHLLHQWECLVTADHWRRGSTSSNGRSLCHCPQRSNGRFRGSPQAEIRWSLYKFQWHLGVQSWNQCLGKTAYRLDDLALITRVLFPISYPASVRSSQIHSVIDQQEFRKFSAKL